jgi:hypothetical protein
MAKSKHFYIRRTHRYLGLVLGIQFLIWTVSGLYFSWTNIDEIHGDFQHRQPPHLSGKLNLVSPQLAFEKTGESIDSIHVIQLVSILSKPYYIVQYFSGKDFKKILVDATTGDSRASISKDESIKIASESFNGDPKIKRVEFITSTNGHHEYREKPLPAWAVTFQHPTSTTVYVSADRGQVESFRNNKWRLFDFLWMGHTMDYQSRDNFNNWLLRIFSVFGLLTVLSGFLLFWISRKNRKRNTIINNTLINVKPSI